ncbi:hypothetical protein TIFTF001_006296 [Ficus carica]|uniref:SAP domain-containing protein n=1 Tax=Ficus carica TaxID=3494 RepID=A0AA87ZML3_FICCA|nr:hypothetical protein TIFTF001_006296 [Ficus carica]
MEIGKAVEDLSAIAEYGSDYSSNDSDNDPTYTILEETHSKLSKLSINNNKKAKARMVDAVDLVDESDSDGGDVVLPELDEVDEKSFLQVQRMVTAGQIEKLKVDQCKVYLRKNGLRLSGNKGTLIQRIKEHQEILNGGGEKKYPVSSFVLNCKGDACTGDVVLFEQNVYDMFNIASRSASGGPCGTRIVAGRVVKESYGAAKQQHTFTIEVLWSKGERPLPPLHPLLIKGRNLYRLKTLRQRWEDEGERQKILAEKHSRGSLARSDREVRIQEKEKRKMLRENRISRKEVNRSQSHSDSTLVPKPSPQPQNFGLSVNTENMDKLAIGHRQLGLSTVSSKPATVAHRSALAANSTKMENQPQPQPQPQRQPQTSGLHVNYNKVTTKCELVKNTRQDKYINQASQNLVGNSSSSNRGPNSYLSEHMNWTKEFPNNRERIAPDIHEVHHMSNRPHLNQGAPISYLSEHTNWTKEFPSNRERIAPDIHEVHHMSNQPHLNHRAPNSYLSEHKNWTKEFPSNRERIAPNIHEVHHMSNWPHLNHGGLNSYLSEHMNWTKEFPKRTTDRQPLRSMNDYRYTSPSRRQQSTQQNSCRYYAQGRCYYGDRSLLQRSFPRLDQIQLLIGFRISAPIMIAPTAYHRLTHPGGEVATARAAAACNTVMLVSKVRIRAQLPSTAIKVLSTMSTCTLEEVASSCNAVRFLQLYVYKRRDVSAELVKRAVRNGFKAIVLTVDAPRLGRREADIRNKMVAPQLKNFEGLISTEVVDDDGSNLEAFAKRTFDESLCWEDLQWLRSITNLPILIKGVLTREDDVFKALALGAQAVLVGRPVVYGLAAMGENGVKSVIEMLKNELELTMALSGCPSIRDITRSHVMTEHERLHSKLYKPATEAHQSGLAANAIEIANQAQAQAQTSGLCVDHDKVTTKCGLVKYIDQASQNLVGNSSSRNRERISTDIHEVRHMSNRPHSNHRGPNSYLSEHMNRTKEFPKRTTHRQPLRSMNDYHYMSSSRRQHDTRQNLCRYYAQGLVLLWRRM